LKILPRDEFEETAFGREVENFKFYTRFWSFCFSMLCERDAIKSMECGIEVIHVSAFAAGFLGGTFDALKKIIFQCQQQTRESIIGVAACGPFA
jgi:hypothetical protein